MLLVDWVFAYIVAHKGAVVVFDIVVENVVYIVGYMVVVVVLWFFEHFVPVNFLICLFKYCQRQPSP